MKYRIWNKMDGKFYTYSKLDTTRWLVDMNGNLGYMDLTDFSWGGLIPKGFYELNRFVLKESPNGRNGKDIYEGDYISIYPNDHEVYEVKWDKYRWILEDINDGRLEYLYDNYGNQKLFNLVGNKYEGFKKE